MRVLICIWRLLLRVCCVNLKRRFKPNSLAKDSGPNTNELKNHPIIRDPPWSVALFIEGFSNMVTRVPLALKLSQDRVATGFWHPPFLRPSFCLLSRQCQAIICEADIWQGLPHIYNPSKCTISLPLSANITFVVEKTAWARGKWHPNRHTLYLCPPVTCADDGDFKSTLPSVALTQVPPSGHLCSPSQPYMQYTQCVFLILWSQLILTDSPLYECELGDLPVL